jgi:hypothetical protein
MDLTTSLSDDVSGLTDFLDQPVVPKHSLTSLGSDSENEQNDEESVDFSFLDEKAIRPSTFTSTTMTDDNVALSPHKSLQQHDNSGISSANAPSPGSTASLKPLDQAVSNMEIPDISKMKSQLDRSSNSNSDSDSDSDDEDIASLLNRTRADASTTSSSQQHTQASPQHNPFQDAVSYSISNSDSDFDVAKDSENNNVVSSDRASARKAKRRAHEDEEWVPASLRSSSGGRRGSKGSKGSSKGSPSNKRQRSAALNEEYKHMPFGGLMTQHTFHKLLEHGRMTQTFSDVSEKDLVQQRHSLPSYCFLSIYESSEHTGQLLRRYPYCDENGLISKKLVKRIRKDLTKFKKETDLLKKQDYPLMQTPYLLHTTTTATTATTSSR